MRRQCLLSAVGQLAVFSLATAAPRLAWAQVAPAVPPVVSLSTRDSLLELTRRLKLRGVDDSLRALDSAYLVSRIHAATERSDTAKGIRQQGGTVDVKAGRGFVRSALAVLVSSDSDGCRTPSGYAFRFCGLIADNKTDRAAGRRFWSGMDTSGISFLRQMNVQGLGDSHSQSTNLELLSDFWGMWRVGLSGVFSGADTVTDHTKGQQFLNGGGPAVLTLFRPVALISSGLLNTRIFGHAQASFTLPAQDSVTRDSLKYLDTGFDVQTTIAGTANTIGGLFQLHTGRVWGGRALYTSLGSQGGFWLASFGAGIIIQQSVAVVWTKVLTGPNILKSGDDLIGVRLMR